MASEVLRYFLRHPETADDLEAVARWRVKLQHVDDTLDLVARALGFLVERGYLNQEPSDGDPKARYRLNAQRRAEAERFLAGALGDDPLLATACAWLDAVLLRYHLRHPAEQGDLPGLSRDRASVERLLGASAAEVRGDDSAEQAAVETSANLFAALNREDAPEPLARLHARLGLTELELEFVLLCLAPELDAKYQTVFGIFNDDLGRRTVTLGLACAILGDPRRVRDALMRAGGISNWRLLDHGQGFPYADESLRLEQVLVAWLLGDEAALLTDARYAHLLCSEPWPEAPWLAPQLDPAVEGVLDAVFFTGRAANWVVLTGPDRDGWRASIEMRARVGVPLLRIEPVWTFAADAGAFEESVSRLARAALLLGSIPVLDASEASNESAPALRRLIAAIEQAGCRGFVIAHTAELVHSALPPSLVRVFHRPAPSSAELAEAYRGAAAGADLTLTFEQAERLARTFPLPLGDVLRATRIAALTGVGERQPDQQFALFSAVCRRVAAPELPRFARPADSTFGLADVVLPEDRRAQLEEVVSHVLHATHVLDRWGFGAKLPYGRGVAALFFGPSGTGKTMAAQAIACELKTQTYVVDLSRVVSKFIGESEKNLDCVFNDAERAGAVLLFDEADALFGKRSEIKDAHDRYANIEVAYLLQRIEAFTGLAILTTNLRQNVDQAFLRRLRFVVEFPKPDVRGREAIWRQCLPDTAPRLPDVDFAALARRLDLTGGNIRQITLRAAFAAASEGATAIAMRHVLGATRAELRKLGMPIAERELADFENTRAKRVA